jgi:hypothetical protein
MLVGVDAPLFGVVAAGVVPELDGGTLEAGAGEFKTGKPFGLGAGLLMGVALGDADGEGAGVGLEAGKEPVAPLRIAPLYSRLTDPSGITVATVSMLGAAAPGVLPLKVKVILPLLLLT